MLVDMLRVLRAVKKAEKIFVATNYQPLIRQAAEYGWQVLSEECQVSESASVDAASRICATKGVTHLLRVPLDIPLAQSADIDELLGIDCHAPAAVLVPSRDGRGTNALLRCPPTLFASHFGPGSFAKHEEEAKRVGAHTIVIRNGRLEFDVDDQYDLEALSRHDLRGTEVGRWIRKNRVGKVAKSI
jgi:2-phospho-L-lactate guanylyltransferase